MSNYIIINSDPRVVADIEVRYPKSYRKFVDNLLEAIIILPIYKSPISIENFHNALNNNNITSSIYFHGQDYMKIISEGYGHKFFSDILSFLSFLSPDANLSTVDNILAYIVTMINDFSFSGISNGNIVLNMLSNEEPSTARVIYRLLSESGIGVHVIFYNYHPDVMAVSNISLSEVFKLIHTKTNFTRTAEIFIEGGLRYSNFRDRTIVNTLKQLIDQIGISPLFQDDIMYVFDSHYYLCLKDAYNKFIEEFPVYSISNPKHYNKMLLAGWYKDDGLIMPPSYAYLKTVLVNYDNVKRFDSIVNKKTYTLYNKPIICNPTPGVVRTSIFEDNDLIEGKKSTANTLYRVAGSKFNVFLTDYTLLNEANILRYENAVRAALYGKRKVESIMARYIGLRRSEIDLKSIEQMVNIELEEEIDLKSYVTINPEIQTDENTIIVDYFVEMPITTYQVRLLFSASALGS